jgi:ATP-dependent Lon protease
MSDSVEMMPLLPLRDVVIYPHMVIPLFVGRQKSIKALENAILGNKRILLVTQIEATQDEPNAVDIYDVGTVSNILQLLKLPDGTVKVLVEGVKRGKVSNINEDAGFFNAQVAEMVTTKPSQRESEVLIRSLLTQFESYVKLNKKIPAEILSSLSGIDEHIRLVDTIAAHMSLKISEKQEVLAQIDLKSRIEFLMSIMESEIDLLQIERRIRTNVKAQMEKSQREYYLNEKMKAIQQELGGDDSVSEIEQLRSKIQKAGMSEEAKTKALSELRKLQMMSPMSAEATVCRNYIDWMVNVPWKKQSKIEIDLLAAQKILDEQHYGLEKVKERIIEYLAVQKRVKQVKGSVLCLVGPPGVGKTSLGQSIAKATGRKFVRISLGGVRDEAEIRGHRKTYIGAMPGKILQKLAKCGVKNPLILLDEIDKMSSDFRGDPASALLEVLDPEQNRAFNDHYLEVDYDLSNVMFVATSNSFDIPAPLLDRMEVIKISGYTEPEKLNIATNHLLNKQRLEAGIKNNELEISQGALLDIIRYYTREAGVRTLDREISKICRKVVRNLLTNKKQTSYNVTPNELESFLGVKKYRFGLMDEVNRIGQVTGLAWTEVGGDILFLEAARYPGKGNIIRTGKLGDVMHESIQAAMTVVKSRCQMLGIEPTVFEKFDVHVHVPEGATPKDGPSAGIGMCTAIASVFTNIPVKRNIAMTGEITLSGQVLPIGGLKEKLLAAKRAGITDVIIPHENMPDLKEIQESMLVDLKIHPVKWIEEVLDLALTSFPVPLAPVEEKIEADANKDAENDTGVAVSTH